MGIMAFGELAVNTEIIEGLADVNIRQGEQGHVVDICTRLEVRFV